MKSNIFYTIILVILFGSCDPQRNCSEPKCIYTDVEAENISPAISGNLDSVIQLGDTLKLTLNLPDTIHTTNYGDLVFGQLLVSSFFGLTAGGGADSIGGEGQGAFYGIEELPTYFVYGNNVSGGNATGGSEEWDQTTRKFECYVVPNKKGLCIIEFTGGRIEMKATDGKEWLVMTSHNFENVDRHVDLFVSWWPPDKQAEAYQTAIQYQNKYYFEVR